MRPSHPFLKRGPDHPAAKLSLEDRSLIRFMHKKGRAPKELAAMCDVSVQTIYRVLKAS